jgi:methionyl-tRNA formyltransferase
VISAQESTLDDPWLKGLRDFIWAKPAFSMVPIDYEAVPRHPSVSRPRAGHGLRIVFCGIPSDYGTAFLLHLLQEDANVVAAVASTRWQRTHPKPDLIGRIAGHLGRPVEVAADINAEPFIRCLREYAPDLVIMASFDQIVRPDLLAIPRLGWLNIHPSVLPRHRGPEPIYWAIAQGDRESGITLHWAVERIDAGPILEQRTVPILPTDTAGTLCKRLVVAGLEALDATLIRLAAGDTHGRLPDLDAGSYDPPVRAIQLDLEQPFAVVDRTVRAGQPDQRPVVTWKGEQLFVEGVRRVQDRGERSVGELKLPAGRAGGELLAVCADAVVALRWGRQGHRHATRPLRGQQFP